MKPKVPLSMKQLNCHCANDKHRSIGELCYVANGIHTSIENNINFDSPDSLLLNIKHKCISFYSILRNKDSTFTLILSLLKN